MTVDSGSAESDAGAVRARRRGGLGIQSKLLIMLLGVSLASALIVGIIGYTSGRESLREAAFDQLTTVRELRVGEIESMMATLRTGVELDSRNESAVQGARELIAGYDALSSATLSDEQDAALRAFYDEQFVPALEERSGLDYSTDALLPAGAAGRYLQAHYTAGRSYDDFDTGLELFDAGDGSAWSAASATWGPYFAGLVKTLGYEDVLVIDRDLSVVFSAYRSVDLGVDLTGDLYADTTLTTSVEQLYREGSLNATIVTDFERYLPSLNVPTAWVVSPIGSGGEIEGALAVQVPIGQINRVMTGDERWAQQGLGTTGEVYLAGPDKLMRSASRELIENPDRFVEDVTANGTPRDTAERIARVKGTILLQPVDTYSVNQALQGKTGTSISTSYLGKESITAYSPVEVEGLQWVAVAHIETGEAFAPVTDFTRNLLLSTLGIMLAVSVLSLLLAQVFTRPIRRLGDAVRRIAGGDLTAQVATGSRDEFGDLGAAFNDMATSLRVKQELIDEQQLENRRLLHTLMPESLAERYKAGEQAIAEQHDNVSVVYAELVGFDDYSRGLAGGEEVTQLNLLMRGFDEAAQKVGIEKVRTLRGGYLASSGLVVPRIDNVRRAVDFALQMAEVIERFNVQNGASLGLRAGVDTGTVTSGLVARTNLAYDLWGDAVSIAYRARNVSSAPGIYVSQTVRDRLQDTVTFSAAGTVDVRGSEQTVWRVES